MEFERMQREDIPVSAIKELKKAIREFIRAEVKKRVIKQRKEKWIKTYLQRKKTCEK